MKDEGAGTMGNKKKAPKRAASRSAKKVPAKRPQRSSKSAGSARTKGASESASVERRATGRRLARKSITEEQRRAMVAEKAYLKAERRGFVGGDPIQDWCEAEAEVDALILRGTETD